jgi:hypothetical protein
MGWVDRSHIDPTTHIHPKKTKSIKSAIVAWKVGTSVV